ncbi:hypothetical protein L7F22_056137 [Adiantum nelumboides]|nr:hypothetical protein [Adiantum nelumboides]
MASRRVLLVAAIVFLCCLLCNVSETAALQHNVGGSAGWTLPSIANLTYQEWDSEQSFLVGDTLFFKYDPNRHNVMVVREEDYNACNFSHPLAMYDDGETMLELDEEGTYFFICGVPGHCDAGQKLTVTVEAGRPAPAASPIPISIPPSASPAMSPSTVLGRPAASPSPAILVAPSPAPKSPLLTPLSAPSPSPSPFPSPSLNSPSPAQPPLTPHPSPISPAPAYAPAKIPLPIPPLSNALSPTALPGAPGPKPKTSDENSAATHSTTLSIDVALRFAAPLIVLFF